MTGKIATPELVESDNAMRCSACGFPFDPARFPDIAKAFQEHVAMFHAPKYKRKTDPT